MISKLQMDGVASFSTATVLETDKKVNLIYGLNGSGKSTISNYLYDTSDAEYKKCIVDLLAEDTVHVYNQRFIRDHFYEADSLKGIFSLSKENKDIEEKIKNSETKLDSLESSFILSQENQEIQEKLTNDRKIQAQNKTWTMKADYSGGDRILEFCLVGLKGKKETLFDHLVSLPLPGQKPNKDIAQLKSEIDRIRGDGAAPIMKLETIDDASFAIEKKHSYTSIIAGKSDSIVATLINDLNNSDWVKKGLEFLGPPSDTTNQNCPFCQELTISNKLATDLDQYFDDAFNDAISEFNRDLEAYEVAAAKLHSTEIYTSTPFGKDEQAELVLRHQELEKIFSNNIDSIKRKILSPNTIIDLRDSVGALARFNSCVNTINKKIVEHNSKLGNIETELNNLKSDFWSLMRWEYDQTISGWLADKLQHEKQVAKNLVANEKAENEISNLRRDISELQKSTVNIDGAVQSINKGLHDLGITEFSLKKHKNALYQIVREGAKSTEFHTLSEGEKMIISFLYFCELCRGKRTSTETPRKKIAVIDDPVSSLSHNYVFNIGQLLKSEFFVSSNFTQVFVLTHSLYFFYELADNHHQRRKDNQRLFRLNKNELGSSFNNMKYEEIQNDYHSYWYVVTDQSQPPALIANCMRNIIEYFFNFVDKADLSNVIQMKELKDNRYQAFCRYINRESHSLGQNIFDYKEFDYDSFREGLRLVFEVTGYSDHYKKMLKAFDDVT